MSIALPNKLSDFKPKLVIFDCMTYFGEQLGRYIDVKCTEVKGPDWLKELGARRQEYKINLHDPAFLLKEILFSDSELRQFLPSNHTFYRDIAIVKRLRNEVFHNNFKGDLNSVLESIQILINILISLDMNQELLPLSNLKKRLQDLEVGIIFSEPSDASIEDTVREKRIADLEDQLAEQNERIRISDEKSLNSEKALWQAQVNYEKLLASQTDTSASVQDLKAELIKAQKVRDELKKRIEIEAETKKELLEERELLGEVNNLLSEIVMDAQKSESFRRKMNVIRSGQTDDSWNVQPFGTKWNREKGKRKIVLSVSKRDLIDSKTNKPLSSIDDASRLELAEKWLELRPSGGRVFLDEEGNACTLIGEDLIYLGTLK